MSDKNCIKLKEEIWYSQKLNINNLIIGEFGINILVLIENQTTHLHGSCMPMSNYATMGKYLL